MNKEIKNNIGFDYEKEKSDSTLTDYTTLAGIGVKLTGLSDRVAGIVSAVFAWPEPVEGIYPKVDYPLNHAIDIIKENSYLYLPIGTVQRGKEDWMNCASNAPNNEIEKQCNYAIENKLFSDELIKWFKDKKYINSKNGKFEIADAFTSIGSGTTETGNSLKAPLQFIENNGVLPKAVLPDNNSMTFEEYHNPDRITQEMKDLAKECRKRLTINYVKEYDFSKIIDRIKWEIIDSYTDPVDGDFIKKLASDYDFMDYGYRVIISEKKTEEKKSWWQKLLDYIKDLFK